MNLVAYNMNEVRATNLLSMVPRENLIVTRDFPCIARVKIMKTFYDHEYLVGHTRRMLYLGVMGKADSFFVQNNGDLTQPDMFPFGVQEVQTTSPLDIFVHWDLTPSERGFVESKGIDSVPPSIMDNNVIEIPVTVNCVGIEGTPCCFMEIVHPECVRTNSKKSCYLDLIFMTEPTAEAIAEKQDEYQYEIMSQNEYLLDRVSIVDTLPPEPEYNEQFEGENEGEEVVIDRTAEAISQRTDEAIKKQNEEYENFKANSTFDADSFLGNAQALAAEKNADNVFGGQRDMYGNLLGQQVSAQKLGYDDIRAFAEKEEEKKKEEVRNVDKANDLKLQNEFGSDADISGMATAADVDKMKSKKDANRQLELNRLADKVADNQALNRGETDIAGQGAGSAVKPSTTQSLLAGLFPKKPKQTPDMGVNTPSQPNPSAGPSSNPFEL